MAVPVVRSKPSAYDVVLLTSLPMLMSKDEFERRVRPWHDKRCLQAIMKFYGENGLLHSEKLHISPEVAEWHLSFKSQSDFLAWTKDCETVFDRGAMARAGFLHRGWVRA